MVIRDNEAWVEEQFGQCDLGDARRTKRIKIVAANMLSKPEKSLPEQNQAWSDVKAAYRLFDQSSVTFDAVSLPHWNCVRQTNPGRYLLISDTTDINRTSYKATTGLGILGDGRSQGVQLHSCLVFNTNDQLIEGSAGAILHYRSRVPKTETRMQRLKRYRESELWGDLVSMIGTAPQGSQWIHVFDRGGDNFEAMARIQLTQGDWVIRAAKLNRKVITEQGEKMYLADAIGQARQLGGYELNLRSRQGVKARTAHIKVSVIRVTFPMPQYRSGWLRESGFDRVSMNVVVVQESKAPQGASAVSWALLTSLPVDSFEDAWQVIKDYEHRWLIEEYHKVIKTGCNIEGPALQTAERLEPLLGLIAIIGIRLFQMKLIGRSQPEAKARTHVPACWLKCLKLARPKTNLTNMTVYQFFRELAKLGGFLARKHDGEPGWQTVWRGFREMQTILDAVKLVAPNRL